MRRDRQRSRARGDAFAVPGVDARPPAARCVPPFDVKCGMPRAVSSLEAPGLAARRLGTLRHLLGLCLERGIPRDAPRVETALLIGAAQILWLDVPDHAAVDLAVRLVQSDRRGARYAGLVNAV